MTGLLLLGLRDVAAGQPSEQDEAVPQSPAVAPETAESQGVPSAADAWLEGGELVLMPPGTPSGAIVTLAVGARFRVVLAGNPATGFLWETAELDPSRLQPLGHRVGMPAHRSRGGEVSYSFVYQALRTGATRLRLDYRRPFEAGIAPSRRFDLVLDIR